VPKKRTVVSCTLKPRRFWSPRRWPTRARVGVVEQEVPLQLLPGRHAREPAEGGRLPIGEELDAHARHPTTAQAGRAAANRSILRRCYSDPYLNHERPPDAATDRVFVVLKGPRRGQPLSAEGLDEVLTGARRRAGLGHGTCHELRHTCLTRLREAGMAIEALQAQAGHRSIASTRVYLHLASDWLATEYHRAAQAIEAQGSIGAGR
jgi:hypothetical protein